MSAAGERHAEEISKILAETDVYVKYGLHQKAVDHLRRVFALDPENVEAHERLKDIFVSQGREQEAEVELLKLAEVDRAERSRSRRGVPAGAARDRTARTPARSSSRAGSVCASRA